jgi:hypothetical protein
METDQAQTAVLQTYEVTAGSYNEIPVYSHYTLMKQPI